MPQQALNPSGVIFVILLIILGMLTAMAGVPPLYDYQHDVFFLLDNGYRVFQGQMPYRDFSSAWGPGIFLIEAAGLALSGMQPYGIAYAAAIVGGLIALWTFWLVRRYWPPVYACLLGLYAMLLSVAPYPIGNHALAFSTAMNYNRFGYALFALLLLECSARLLDKSPPKDTAGAFSSGLAFGLLAFLKISFALIAVPVLAFGFFVRASDRIHRLAAMSAGAMLVLLGTLGYLRLTIVDMLQDLHMAAVARQTSLQIVSKLAPALSLPSVFLLLLACYLLALHWKEPGKLAQKAFLLALLTLLTGWCLLVTNQQLEGFPLCAYTAVACFAVFMPLSKQFPARILILGLLTAPCLMPQMVEDGFSLVFAARERWSPSRPVVQNLDAPVYGSGLRFSPVKSEMKSESNGQEYVSAVNDGLALLRNNTTAQDGVLTFDMFNPFNYLLGRPSPRGGFAAAADNYIFNDAHHPDPSRFFGDTRYVMVRKFEPLAPDRIDEGKDTRALIRIYGNVLKENFILAKESRYWVLWRKK